MSTESMVTQAALEIAREAHAQQAERDEWKRRGRFHAKHESAGRRHRP